MVASGKAVCAPCLEPIVPGEEWHLDHSDTRQGYIGISHAWCNLRAAAAKTNGQRREATVIREQERPYRWSQKWFDDPPIGTIVYGNEQVIYLGNGEWQPLDDTTNQDACLRERAGMLLSAQHEQDHQSIHGGRYVVPDTNNHLRGGRT